MKKTLLILLSAFCFTSCAKHEESNIKIEQLYTDIRLSPDLEKRLSEFIDWQDTTTCIYEMYVDKNHPGKTIVTLRRRHKSMRLPYENMEPILSFNFRSRKIFLITGIESVFKTGSEKDIYKGYSDDYRCYKVLEITYEADSVEVDSMIFSPFYPKGKIDFLPPQKK